MHGYSSDFRTKPSAAVGHDTSWGAGSGMYAKYYICCLSVSYQRVSTERQWQVSRCIFVSALFPSTYRVCVWTSRRMHASYCKRSP